MNAESKQRSYGVVRQRVKDLIADETDLIAVMATVACELHHAFDYFDWTGFYRVVAPGLLKIGPYQGTHGCLTIPFERGVCGAAARLRQNADRARCPRVPGIHRVLFVLRARRSWSRCLRPAGPSWLCSMSIRIDLAPSTRSIE